MLDGSNYGFLFLLLSISSTRSVTLPHHSRVIFCLPRDLNVHAFPDSVLQSLLCSQQQRGDGNIVMGRGDEGVWRASTSSMLMRNKSIHPQVQWHPKEEVDQCPSLLERSLLLFCLIHCIHHFFLSLITSHVRCF